MSVLPATLANEIGSENANLRLQLGRIIPSTRMSSPIFGGNVNPRRTSRSRRPSMAASTVMHSTSKPASAARRIMSLSRPLSRHTYTWNHFEPLLTAATSSTERVPIVDSE